MIASREMLRLLLCWFWQPVPRLSKSSRIRSSQRLWDLTVCRECSKFILENYAVVHHRIHQQPLSAGDFIIYVSRPTMPRSIPPEPLIYLAIFGWVSPTTLSHCRPDVRDRYARNMNFIHKIARSMLLAVTDQPYDPGHFRSFNLTLIEDIQAYKSTISNVFFYFLVLTALYMDENITPDCSHL